MSPFVVFLICFATTFAILHIFNTDNRTEK